MTGTLPLAQLWRGALACALLALLSIPVTAQQEWAYHEVDHLDHSHIIAHPDWGTERVIAAVAHTDLAIGTSTSPTPLGSSVIIRQKDDGHLVWETKLTAGYLLRISDMKVVPGTSGEVIAAVGHVRFSNTGSFNDRGLLFMLDASTGTVIDKMMVQDANPQIPLDSRLLSLDFFMYQDQMHVACAGWTGNITTLGPGHQGLYLDALIGPSGFSLVGAMEFNSGDGGGSDYDFLGKVVNEGGGMVVIGSTNQYDTNGQHEQGALVARIHYDGTYDWGQSYWEQTGTNQDDGVIAADLLAIPDRPLLLALNRLQDQKFSLTTLRPSDGLVYTTQSVDVHVADSQTEIIKAFDLEAHGPDFGFVLGGYLHEHNWSDAAGTYTGNIPFRMRGNVGSLTMTLSDLQAFRVPAKAAGETVNNWAYAPFPDDRWQPFVYHPEMLELEAGNDPNIDFLLTGYRERLINPDRFDLDIIPTDEAGTTGACEVVDISPIVATDPISSFAIPDPSTVNLMLDSVFLDPMTVSLDTLDCGQLSSPPCILPFAISATTDCLDADPIAIGGMDPAFIHFTWDFGDGSAPLTGTNLKDPPAHTYAAAGTYTITLTSTCTFSPTTDTRTVDVTVEDCGGGEDPVCEVGPFDFDLWLYCGEGCWGGISGTRAALSMDPAIWTTLTEADYDAEIIWTDGTDYRLDLDGLGLSFIKCFSGFSFFKGACLRIYEDGGLDAGDPPCYEVCDSETCLSKTIPTHLIEAILPDLSLNVTACSIEADALPGEVTSETTLHVFTTEYPGGGDATAFLDAFLSGDDFAEQAVSGLSSGSYGPSAYGSSASCTQTLLADIAHPLLVYAPDSSGGRLLDVANGYVETDWSYLDQRPEALIVTLPSIQVVGSGFTSGDADQAGNTNIPGDMFTPGSGYSAFGGSTAGLDFLPIDPAHHLGGVNEWNLANAASAGEGISVIHPTFMEAYPISEWVPITSETPATGQAGYVPGEGIAVIHPTFLTGCEAPAIIDPLWMTDGAQHENGLLATLDVVSSQPASYPITETGASCPAAIAYAGQVSMAILQPPFSPEVVPTNGVGDYPISEWYPIVATQLLTSETPDGPDSNGMSPTLVMTGTDAYGDGFGLWSIRDADGTTIASGGQGISNQTTRIDTVGLPTGGSYTLDLIGDCYTGLDQSGLEVMLMAGNGASTSILSLPPGSVPTGHISSTFHIVGGLLLPEIAPTDTSECDALFSHDEDATLVALAPGAVPTGPGTPYEEDMIQLDFTLFSTITSGMYGQAWVGPGLVGIGDGNVLHLANLNARYDVSAHGDVERVELTYFDGGSFANLRVNGEALQTGTLSGMPAAIAPGVTLTVLESAAAGYTHGTILLEGPVHSVEIGGTQFYVDNVCVVTSGTLPGDTYTACADCDHTFDGDGLPLDVRLGSITAGADLEVEPGESMFLPFNGGSFTLETLDLGNGMTDYRYATYSQHPAGFGNGPSILLTDIAMGLPVQSFVEVTDTVCFRVRDESGAGVESLIINGDNTTTTNQVTTTSAAFGGLLAFDNTVIGGVRVEVTGSMTPSGDAWEGTVTLIGDVNHLHIGGELLWVDDLCLSAFEFGPLYATYTCPGNIDLVYGPNCEVDSHPNVIGVVDVAVGTECPNGSITVTTDYTDATTTGVCSDLVIERTWHIVATDNCGHLFVASCIQLITVTDDQGPTIFGPEDTTVDCAELGGFNAFAYAMGITWVVQDCSEITHTETQVTAIPGNCLGESHIITHLAEDACGNQSSYSFTVMVIDDTPPTITGSSEVNVDCTQYSYLDAHATAEDDCSSVSFSWTDAFSSPSSCGGTVIRQYTAVDECGNASAFTQFIHLIDEEAPILSIQCPPDVTLDCATADLDPSETGMPTYLVEDNCDPDVEVSITHTDMWNYSCPVSAMIERTWEITAVDHCDNSTLMTCSQTIAIVDDTAPVVDGPAALQLDCGDAAPTAEALSDLLTVSDDCSLWEFALAGLSGSDDCGGTLTYTLVVVDFCGNATEHVIEVTFGECAADTDADGICDADEIAGCTDPGACDYNADATDLTGCDYSCIGCTDPEADNYNPNATIDNGFCIVHYSSNDCDLECDFATDFDSDYSGASYGSDESGASVVIMTTPGYAFTSGAVNISAATVPYVDGSSDYGFMTVETAGDLGVGRVLYLQGIRANFDIEEAVPTTEAVCFAFRVTGSSIGFWLNGTGYVEPVDYFDGFSNVPIAGCLITVNGHTETDADGNVTGYAGVMTITGDVNSLGLGGEYMWIDDLCIAAGAVAGCTYPEADNFNPEAEEDDGSCQFTGEEGCMDPMACNYNPNATSLDPDLPCLYPVPGYNCLGECIQDVNQNGLCDFLEEQGCMDEEACNYNPNATSLDPNLPCLYPVPGYNCLGEGIISGCLDPAACNYDPQATNSVPDLCAYPVDGYDCQGYCDDVDEDGTCDLHEVDGCTYPEASNYDPDATEDDGTCDLTVGNACPTDINGDGVTSVNDLIELLGQFSLACDE